MKKVVWFFDVDNTLLDNDRVTRDLRLYLRRHFGPKSEKRYFELFETLRAQIGYADYLGALQRYRSENPTDPEILRMSAFLIQYPFRKRLFPGALSVMNRFARRVTTVILSDGDAVFQPHKVVRSGLWQAVRGRVLIFVNKEKMLKQVERLYPARRYVMVDDKLRILAAMKRVWGAKLTTVFVRQGHYARDPKQLARYPPADLTVGKIGDLSKYL